MSTTTDPDDPRLGRGVDKEPIPQHEVYLVLSDEERLKGFVRPLRSSYLHVGPSGPTHPLRDLTLEELTRNADFNYVKYEEYPADPDSSVTGRFWTQEQLDAVDRGGCGTTTTMNSAIAETYARNPGFYGATYCAHCRMHKAVDEFVWIDERTGVATGEKVGS